MCIVSPKSRSSGGDSNVSRVTLGEFDITFINVLGLLQILSTCDLVVSATTLNRRSSSSIHGSGEL